MNVLAVYGTLKSRGQRGTHNHWILNQFTILEKFEGRVFGYKMYTQGAFPFAIPAGQDDSIAVEVYYIVDVQQALARLDRLEGFVAPNDPGNFYERVKVWVNLDEEPPVRLEAYMYVYKTHVPGLVEIEDGCW